MAKISENAYLTDQLIDEMVAEYSKVPEAFVNVDKKLLKRALKLSGGNYHRITKETDGSLIVWNYCIW